MNLLFFKALHIIGFVTWFAGIFYLVRLFVYHKEELESDQPSDKLLAKFKLMEGRLFFIITNPGMLITWGAGLSMLYIYGLEWLKLSSWMHIKLVFLFLLTIYHFWLWRSVRQFKKDKIHLNSWKYRLLNEVPTLILVVVVFLAVYKSGLSLAVALSVFFALGIILFAAAYLYKKQRG